MVDSWEGGRGLRITSKSETLSWETGLIKVSFHELRLKRENKFCEKKMSSISFRLLFCPKR